MLEDSPLDAELATLRLRKADLACDITVARDRQEFVDALEAGPYDLLLADYALPDFDGIAALTLAREKLPHTPFIFISGRVGEEVAIDTLQRGATDYVLKHRLERLVPAVQRALNEADEHATRMQAEAMFRQSEMRFRHVIDAVPQMIWVASPDGRLAYSNQVWKETVPEGIEVWCDPTIFHPSDFPATLASWQVALENVEPFTLEVRMLCRTDGSFRWHLLRVTPMAAEPQTDARATGEPEMHWLGTSTDIQDRKLNEEALRTAEKLSVTGRLAASIAHEINNPLESLTNLLYLIRAESAGNERALNFLSMTENELERISSITKQTLQFYRDPAMPVTVDARQILEEVERLFIARLRAKGIHLELDVPPGLTFEAIKGEIRQVLINLVNNAIDAVQQGGRIQVQGAVQPQDGRQMLVIKVRDNGSGISPEQAQRLFQPFFSTKGAHGTGLGLWVSKGIIEKHNGTLKLGSRRDENGQGASETVATVTLPLTVRDAAVSTT